MFYNGRYPYIIDNDGEVRWYLNSNYYGNITILDNSNFIIGSDRYNENANVISFYKMNYLGKIYNEYMVNEYYGISTLYHDNILVLSDRIFLIDIQSGEIIYDYGKNDGFNYLGVYEEDMVVCKDKIYYKLKDNSLEQMEYIEGITKINFYDNTGNYKIVLPNRFGNLKETLVSKEKIPLVGYDKLEVLENINIVKEIDRIKIINNNKENIYVILDKFMDKRIYEIDTVKYITMENLYGKYTIYLKIDGRIYKTDYYIEVQ